MRRVELEPEAWPAIEAAARASGSWLYRQDAEGHAYLGGGLYELDGAEADVVARAAAELHDLCLGVLDAELERDDGWRRLGLPAWTWPYVRSSWRRADDLPSLLVRFDLAPVLDAGGRLVEVRLLEANAQTPTSLPEAAGFQWDVASAVRPGAGQWNALWERLVEAWGERLPHLPPGPMAFCWSEADPTGEDATNVIWVAEAATRAAQDRGAPWFDAVLCPLEELEVRDHRGRPLVDVGGEAELARAGTSTWAGTTYWAHGRRVRSLYVLEPWEQMLARPGAALLLRRSTPEADHPDRGQDADGWASPDRVPLGPSAEDVLVVVEPLWKVAYSNKALLARLWEAHPGHPHLLPAYDDGPRELVDWVRKPFFSREGADLAIHVGGRVVAEGAPRGYGAEGHVWQSYVELPAFVAADGSPRHPVLGAWVIGDEACGLGIRESVGPITDDRSAFAAHVLTDTTADQLAARGGLR